MNITFKLSRFFKIVKKDIIEFQNTLLSLFAITSIGIATVTLCFYLFSGESYLDINKDIFYIIDYYFSISFLVTILLFMTVKLSSYRTRLSYLMLPASYTEKFTAEIFITLIIIPLIIIVSLFIGYEFVFQILKIICGLDILPLNMNIYMNGNAIPLRFIIGGFISIHSLCFLSSLIFRKFVFVKTVFILILYWFHLSLYFIIVSYISKSDVVMSTGGVDVQYLGWIMLVQIISCYVLAYMRLKETELIDNKF